MKIIVILLILLTVPVYSESFRVESGQSFGNSIAVIPFSTVAVEQWDARIEHDGFAVYDDPSETMVSLQGAFTNSDVQLTSNTLWVIEKTSSRELFDVRIPDQLPSIHESFWDNVESRLKLATVAQRRFYFIMTVGPITAPRHINRYTLEYSNRGKVFGDYLVDLLSITPSLNCQCLLLSTDRNSRGFLGLPRDAWDDGYEFIVLVGFELQGHPKGQSTEEARLRRLSHIIGNREKAIRLFFEPEYLRRQLLAGDRNAETAISVHQNGAELLQGLLEGASDEEVLAITPYRRLVFKSRYQGDAPEEQLVDLLARTNIEASVRHKALEHLAYTGVGRVDELMVKELQNADEITGHLIDAAFLRARAKGNEMVADELKRVRASGTFGRNHAIGLAERLMEE